MHIVKSDEVKNVAITFSLMLLLFTANNIGLLVIQTLVVKRIGIEFLPYINILTLLVIGISYIGANLLAKILDSSNLVFFSTLGICILLVIVRFFFHPTDNPAVKLEGYFIASTLLLLLAVIYSQIVLIPLIWTLIQKTFGTLQLKRLMPFFASPPVIGGILASLIVQPFLVLTNIVNIIFVWSSLFGAFACIYYMYIVEKVKFNFKGSGSSTLSIHEVSDFWHVKNWGTLESKFIFVLIITSFFSSFMTYTMNYQLAYVANKTFSNENNYAFFFSVFQITYCGLALLYFLTFQHRVLHYLGVFGSLVINTIILIIGFSIIIFTIDIWMITLFMLTSLFSYISIYLPARQFAYGIITPKHQANIRTIAEIVAAVGIVASGMFLMFVPQMTMISIVSLAISVLWFLTLEYGKKIYSLTLLKNICNKNLLFTTLESLEDGHDTKINAALWEILEDDVELSTKEDKIKVIETFQRLGNPQMIRHLSISMHHKDPEIRIASIAGLSKLVKESSYNPFVHYFVFQEMKKILKIDCNDRVRGAAAKFLFENTPKERHPELFTQILHSKDSQDSKFIALHTLKNLNIHLDFVDLIEFNFLQDNDPDIRGEAASLLWSTPPYQKKCEKVINELLEGENETSILSGLKALTFTIFREKKEVIGQLLSHSNIDIRLMSNLLWAASASSEIEQKTTLNEIMRIIISNPHMNEEHWKEFIYHVLQLGDDMIDKFLVVCNEHYKNDPLNQEMQFFAEILHNRLLPEEH